MRACLLILLAAMCGACGSPTVIKVKKASTDGGTAAMVEAAPPKPIGVVMGMVKGVAFEPKGGGAQDSGPLADGMYPFVRVELDDVSSGGCVLDAMAERSLSFWVYNSKDGTAVGPGTYKGAGAGVDTNGTVFPNFHWKDAAVEASNDGGGTVTLDEVSPASIRGSFDVTLVTNGQDVGHLSGTFDSPACN